MPTMAPCEDLTTTLVRAAVGDYRGIVTPAEEERLATLCLEAVATGRSLQGFAIGERTEMMAQALLDLLTPGVSPGIRATLAWICGDIAQRYR
ncbi:MAG: hypothetical protein ACTHNS_08950 [Marmoricola sp.]